MLITAAECNTVTVLYHKCMAWLKLSRNIAVMYLVLQCLEFPEMLEKNQFIEADMSTCIHKFKLLHFLLVTQTKESQRASGLFFGPSGLQQTQNCLPLFGPSFFTVLKTQGSLWPLHSGG